MKCVSRQVSCGRAVEKWKKVVEKCNKLCHKLKKNLGLLLGPLFDKKVVICSK